jgi:rubrerythrin
MLEDLTLRKAIEFAIKTEEVGEKLYLKLAKKFADNAEIKGLFETLAQDEAVHQRQFRSLLEQLPEPDGALPYEQDQYLKAMAITDIFYGLHRAFEGSESAEDAMHRALQLEKNTILYYTAMRDAVGESEALDKLIAIEKQHALQLMKHLITGAKLRSLQDLF